MNPPPLKNKPASPIGKLQKPKHGWIVIWVSVAFWMILGEVGLFGVWLVRCVLTSVGFFPASAMFWILSVALLSSFVGASIGTMLLMRLAYARSKS